ncbi:MAG: hypothetical protein NTW50_01420 [Candidatus Berkelbacteria bacterium]|nr:hypothetical protein [Candidatus Berkelbacteria bacterium]
MHTNYHKGTPLYIILRNGEVKTGKFSDHRSGKVILEGGEEILLDKVRAMSIRKLETEVSKSPNKSKIYWRIK